ncbi:DNA repair protein RecN [Lentiprolixibacter aurantiacus]|uniref:DNA repair protein RecN n=1 Tax=Lentiprolixibacter aurantiacus TaxID=2993939 RepID=A0AAE3SN54_9FLAO|nr:DNA repair protein RecN [Lentiprolixibacter aurantiacus]MCX2719382.1 DNA repair protein RecN [Lentiprolixibacter aurantiacus]
MLKQLSIKNYALIDDLNVKFSHGFTTITGETGAGKSIFLGGLSLVLGKRADRSTLRDQDNKCIIEAEFEIGSYNLREFFANQELDYDDHSILRREILPSGKSRAFINDTPVTLDVLSALGGQLIDIHSQHQTLKLTEADFQMKVVDALANNRAVLHDFREKLAEYRDGEKQLQALIDRQQQALKDYDYHSFLLKEIEEAKLEGVNQEDLEAEHEQLTHVEEILEQLSQASQTLQDEQMGLLSTLGQLKQICNKLSPFGQHFQTIADRINSVYIELDDLAAEIEQQQESQVVDPARLEKVGATLQSLYTLQKKHAVATVEELLQIKQELEDKVLDTNNLDSQIGEMRLTLDNLRRQLEEMSLSMREQRTRVIPNLVSELESMLKPLGMPNARFKVSLQELPDFASNGKDSLIMDFSANMGSGFEPLKKVASGGELSRIMLVIKAVLARYENLPTMMFDEIDTGVSGEVSNRMGDIMTQMSRRMQVFSITHLPQVASKGDQHFKVFKEDKEGVTHTRMKQLQPEERIVELAEMLGGKSLSESALAHARQLLN